MKNADVWVVAGPPGGGKTTVSEVLLTMLNPVPALLDKDTLYGPFVREILSKAHRPAGEREGKWYNEHIKPFEYQGLTDTAREIRSKGCPVLLSGPFTQQIHDPVVWEGWVKGLGGDTVHLVWVNTDAETLKSRLVSRGSERDTQKLTHFDEFIAYMKPGVAPQVPHIAIDNRLTAEHSIEDQLGEALRNNNVFLPR